MNTVIKNIRQKIVFMSSIVTLILFTIMLIVGINAAIRISRTIADLLTEFFTMIFLFPLIIPAIFGVVLFFRKSKVIYGFVVILYVLYFLINILVYTVYFQATDALEAGFLFVILAEPFSVVLSIILACIVFKDSVLYKT